MSYISFVKDPVALPVELEEVRGIAEQLRDHLDKPEVLSAIKEQHVINGTSQQIQAVLSKGIEDLGFEREKRGLFKEQKVSSLRPDFYRKVGTSGILLEIERGKTITNNMDLLDLWKCHLCPTADFLFLVVPNKRVSENGTSIRAFEQASKRLSTFFQPGYYVNVQALFLFGY
ncbi:MAG: hypothetical protein ABSD44_13660 [Terracidiphilus sp.]|jgi:hypothetical protein